MRHKGAEAQRHKEKAKPPRNLIPGHCNGFTLRIAGPDKVIGDKTDQKAKQLSVNQTDQIDQTHQTNQIDHIHQTGP